MSDSVEHGDGSVGGGEDARHGVEQAETGDATAVERLEHARNADPAGVDAAEQEASDGPEGRGLSR